MGAGTRRKNIPVVITGGQVVTESGGLALDCSVDQDCDATPVDMPRLPVGERGEIVADSSHWLVLVVNHVVVAALHRSLVTERIRSCLARGYSFTGVLTGPEVVRVTGGA